ncbi:MAG: hypothetical protein IPM37_07400 [Hahellaceae bacterium]|nr:hypothetical protein [Hahellaceae bacterium]
MNSVAQRWPTSRLFVYGSLSPVDWAELTVDLGDLGFDLEKTAEYPGLSRESASPK